MGLTFDLLEPRVTTEMIGNSPAGEICLFSPIHLFIVCFLHVAVLQKAVGKLLGGRDYFVFFAVFPMTYTMLWGTEEMRIHDCNEWSMASCPKNALIMAYPSFSL